MTRRRLLSRLDFARVEQAIRTAERTSNIEVRVSVSGLFWGDPQRVAERAFERLRMSATRERTGILVLVTPWRRRVIVVADEGVTAKIPDAFWTIVIARISEEFRRDRFTEGLVEAIETMGRDLALHFPPRAVDSNELPNEVDRGRPV